MNEMKEKIKINDILFKSSESDLQKIMDVSKAISFFSKAQKNDGYFLCFSPHYHTTYFCCGILNLYQKPISKETVNFLKSCRVGSMGFSEMPGEIPWLDRTFHILKVFDWFKIKVAEKNEIADFFKSFQNSDGGFQSTSNDYSNLENSFYTIEILRMLKKLEINKEMLIKWLLSISDFDNIKDFYFFLRILSILDFRFSQEQRTTYIDFVNKLHNLEVTKTFKNLYYFIECLEILNFDFRSLISIDEVSITILNNNVEEIFYSEAILQKFKKSTLKNNYEKLIRNMEVKPGGYVSPNELSIFENNKCIHSLFLLNGLGQINKERYIKWLTKSMKNGSWGPAPNTLSSLDHYTRSSITSYLLCGEPINQKLRIIVKNRAIENLQREYGDLSSMKFLRMSREAFEILMMIDYDFSIEKLQNYLLVLKSVSNIKSFYHENGGFGGKIAFMYPTYLALRSLYLIERYSNEDFMQNIKNNTIKWLESCQNQDGGFGPMPNQQSNIQSTFYALNSLYMLNSDVKSRNKLADWISKHQSSDGGFRAFEANNSDALISFYCIGSLVLLNDM